MNDDDFAFSTRGKEDYANLIAQYLPNDKLFRAKNIPDSNLRKLITGVGESFADANNYIKEFTDDISPQVTEKFIAEWESAVGIPDDCFSLNENVVVTQTVPDGGTRSGLNNFLVSFNFDDHGYDDEDLITVSGAPNIREIDSIVLSAVTQGVTSLDNNGSGTVTAVTPIAHGYANGATILIAGANEGQFNGIFIMTLVDASTFEYSNGVNNVESATGTLLVSEAADATVTTHNPHPFSTGDLITIQFAEISAMPVDSINAPQLIVDTGASTFTFQSPEVGTVTPESGQRMGGIKPDSPSYINGAFIIEVVDEDTFRITVSVNDRFEVPDTFTVTTSKTTSVLLSNEQRRIQIITKLSYMAVQTLEDFEDLAEFLGINVRIVPGKDVLRDIDTLVNTLGTALATTTNPHDFFTGQNVTVAGVDPTIVAHAITDLRNTVSATVAVASSTFNHGYVTNDGVVITGAFPTYFNETKPVIRIDDTTFSYTVTGGSTGTATGSPISTHTFDPSYFNGGVIITDTPSDTTFEYPVSVGTSGSGTGSDMTATFLTEDAERFTLVVYTDIDSGDSFPYIFPITFADEQTILLECIFNKVAPANCQVIYFHNQTI